MNTEVDDDQMSLISEYYPDRGYTQFVPEQGGNINNKGGRRRRKKKISEESDNDGVMRKRKLSEEQVNLLEQSFESEHKLESERKDRLAAELGLDPRQVAVWFQNRRARWKAKKLEEEYSKLKSEHETAVLDRCRLHTQLVKMKEQLYKADKEIQRLSDGFSSHSPISSSLSMEAAPPFVGDFGMKGIENEFYNCVHGLEWDNLYYV